MHAILSNWLLQRAQKAVALAPQDAKAWSKLYALYVERQDTAGMLNFCRLHLQRDPSNLPAWKHLRTAGHGIVTAPEALLFSKQIVQRHPDCERAWSQLDLDAEDGFAPADWVTFCREITSQHPNNMHAWTRLMRELKHEAKHADLISACLKAVQVKPDAQTWVNLAEAYAAQSKFEEAVTAYTKALELKPDYLVALNGLGCVYHTQGRLDEAITLYKRATQLRKEDATPWVWLTLAYIQAGQTAQAREALAKVKTALPIVAAMLSEELGTLPEEAKVANPRVPVSRFAFGLPKPAQA